MGAALGNQYAVGNDGGRPAMFTDPAEMQKKIDKWLLSCKTALKDNDGNIVVDGNGEIVYRAIKPIQIIGLTKALGFNSRTSLLNYKDKDEFMDIIIRAKMECEDFAVDMSYTKEGFNGAKFNLVNNNGWVDKQEISASISHVSIVDDLKD